MSGNGDDRQAQAWERVEAEVDELKQVAQQHLAQGMGRKLERFRDDLLSSVGREVRVELLAGQSLNEERFNALERRVRALEVAKS